MLDNIQNLNITRHAKPSAYEEEPALHTTHPNTTRNHMTSSRTPMNFSAESFNACRAAIINSLTAARTAHPDLTIPELYVAGMFVLGQLAAVIDVDPASRVTFDVFRAGYDSAVLRLKEAALRVA